VETETAKILCESHKKSLEVLQNRAAELSRPETSGNDMKVLTPLYVHRNQQVR
jgi:hypothetical protein